VTESRSWRAFAEERPDLADAGGALFYQFGVGLAFLATTRADGAPRVHPVCPLLTDDGLFAFIVPSPKRADLHRDGRFAMHSFPSDDNEDAFNVTGTATNVQDAVLNAALAEQYAKERTMNAPPEDLGSWEAFEFSLTSCLLTRTTGHGDPAPQHTVWHAS
jgi:Pyridoxamine 5'-phosphate oxidase